MKPLLSLCIASIVLPLVSGCASGPNYKEVAGRIPPIPDDKGRIFFFRDSSMFGAALQPTILLNKEEVGDSKAGGFFFVDRAPGSYTVACSTEVTRTVEFTLAVQETRYVMTSATMGFLLGHVEPELVDRTKGESGVKGASYTGDVALLAAAPKP